MVMMVVHEALGIIIQHKARSFIIVKRRIQNDGADNFCCLGTGLPMLKEVQNQLDRHPAQIADI